MTDRPAIPELISASRVIAIGRNVPVAAAPRIGEALVAGGVHVMELTLNEPEADALAAIAALAAAADDLGALVGAGTVLSIDAARRAVDAGARFIVCPHTILSLVAWCASQGCPASRALSRRPSPGRVDRWRQCRQALPRRRCRPRLPQAHRRALPGHPLRAYRRCLGADRRRLDRCRCGCCRHGRLAHRRWRRERRHGAGPAGAPGRRRRGPSAVDMEISGIRTA